MNARKCFGVLLLLLPLVAANADPIRVDWTNTGVDGALLSASGFWVYDDTNVAGFGDYTADFLDFEFEWTTTNGTFTSSSAGGDQVARGFLNFDAAEDLIGFDVCFSTDGTCAFASSSPLIRITGTFWGASGGPGGVNQPNFVFNTLQTVATSPVSVPEPGTLALLGAGLIGVGFARRRKKA